MPDNNTEATKSPILLIDSHHGVHIPRLFAEAMVPEFLDFSDSTCSEEDMKILRGGVDEEFYWETWTRVIDETKVFLPATNQRYYICHDEDLWLVPENETLFGAEV